MKGVSKIVKCSDEDEAKDIERILNEGGIQHAVGVSVSRTVVILDQTEAEFPYNKKTIKAIKEAAKGIRNMRRALSIHESKGTRQ